MSVVFLDPANDELAEAVAYYDGQRVGLGDDFAREAANTIRGIVAHPALGTQLAPNIRRRRTNRFPYTIVYTVRGGDVVIIAVAHQRRKPGYWQGRLTS